MKRINIKAWLVVSYNGEFYSVHFMRWEAVFEANSMDGKVIPVTITARKARKNGN